MTPRRQTSAGPNDTNVSVGRRVPTLRGIVSTGNDVSKRPRACGPFAFFHVVCAGRFGVGVTLGYLRMRSHPSPTAVRLTPDWLSAPDRPVIWRVREGVVRSLVARNRSGCSTRSREYKRVRTLAPMHALSRVRSASARREPNRAPTGWCWPATLCSGVSEIAVRRRRPPQTAASVRANLAACAASPADGSAFTVGRGLDHRADSRSSCSLALRPRYASASLTLHKSNGRPVAAGRPSIQSGWHLGSTWFQNSRTPPGRNRRC